jgi:HD-GYP domain-containing protein (c-di-GMP phosphodiesterase class II)
MAKRVLEARFWPERHVSSHGRHSSIRRDCNCISSIAAFDTDELALLTEVAEDVSYGLRPHRLREDHGKVTERLPHSMEATISAIATTAESRDTYTAGHQRRVAKLAVAIAAKLGLSDNQIQELRLGSIIHYVGKIALPAEILNKPGSLSALEYGFIKQHVEAGYEGAKGIDFPQPISQMIR